MKFFLDEDLSGEIAEIARGSGIDVVSCHEIGRDGLDDRTQLEFVASDSRCLITCNRTDFMNLTMAFYEREAPHNGVLVVTPGLRSQGAARIAAAIAEYERQHSEGMLPYTFGYLSQGDKGCGRS